jgi:hypothetical protein
MNYMIEIIAQPLILDHYQVNISCFVLHLSLISLDTINCYERPKTAEPLS